MAAIAATAAIALLAAIAATATVLSSIGIRDHLNQTICQQDTFWTSTESSLAGVRVNIGIIRMSSDKHPQRNLGQYQHHQDEFGSTSSSADVFEAIFITGQLVAKAGREIDVLYGTWIV